MNEKPYKHWSSREEKVANLLFEIGAVKFGAFRLNLHEKNPSAPLSPIYIDLRLLRSYPGAMAEVVEVLREISQGLEFDYYADIPTAATPIVAILSYLTKIPIITPKKPKTHGTQGSVDGSFRAGKTTLVIDDLITKADSKLKAIKILEANKLKIKDVLVLVDREQGGTEQLKKLDYNLHAVFKLSALLCWYLDTGKISQAKYGKTITYLTFSQ